ncbi:hemolysin family protein [Pseudogracilibacillus auburnensis]|uniref:CBS domain containing-hemolysin-like protein n=1 Tax=Pseudogracilibacillus auburnensis TaxID=1494959 RepID=A0A2V3VPJ9_9BACI|nr:hemolysin family protein [Pseudogracilibacillus auburnensis]MBO1001388.1 HlyC/CorC family transporter [Pseudogracilibacillus auburnensis]PXW83736.1 CBS domain containing-hemolysin-like protein [Pseudogracilibacillus auburnensis]
MEIFNLMMVIILIALTGFFVATEFAIVKVRSTRIEQLVKEGNKNAIAAQKLTDNLDEYLSACQLGITVTALGLGWLGEPTVKQILTPLFLQMNVSDSVSSILSFVLAFSFITFLHVVVGELVPKIFALQKSEKVALYCARPMILFYRTMYPFIKALNGTARFIASLFGVKAVSEHEVAHSEEELRMILSESFKSGEINQSEYQYVDNIFKFDDRIAREIMVPRTEIIAFEKSDTLQDFINYVTEKNYTRYPIFDGDKDNIIGLVNLKEILIHFAKGKNLDDTVEKYVRPVLQVVESIPIHDLLLAMQKERVHMAILMDEYGGTEGMVTVEDILEEIVGDIRDEFDEDEVPEVHKIDENRTIIDGKVLIEDVNEMFGLHIDDTEMDTIGGWMLTEKANPQIGDSVQIDHYEFIVTEADGYHIKTLEIQKIG